LNVAGLVGCVVLAATLPPSAALAGAAVVVAGIAGRALVQRLGHNRS
jgi:APA family basic amino acid/polyamine antiporter